MNIPQIAGGVTVLALMTVAVLTLMIRSLGVRETLITIAGTVGIVIGCAAVAVAVVLILLGTKALS